jgi:hypothetical protein
VESRYNSRDKDNTMDRDAPAFHVVPFGQYFLRRVGSFMLSSRAHSPPSIGVFAPRLL